MDDRRKSLEEKLSQLLQEVAEVEKSLARDYARQAEAGYFYLDEEADVYRPTWKGAYLMTWTFLWPISRLQKMRTKRDAERIRMELGEL